MDILNLEGLKVLQVKETDSDYCIIAESDEEPFIVCPHCFKMNQYVKHGYKKGQLFMDITVHGKRVGIVIDRKRYRCKACQKTFLEDLICMDNKRLMTKRLVEYIEKQTLSKDRSFVSIADEIGIDEKTVRLIFKDMVKRLEEEHICITPEWLGIDEIYLINQPRAVLTNVKENTVLDILSNRKKTTIVDYLKNLHDKENVKVVTMDMWNPYRDAVRLVLPHAKIVVDKFHVVRMANQCLETVRKELRKSLTSTQRKVLKNERYVLLKRQKDLTIQETINMEAWTKSFPILGMAYDLKEAFYFIWDCDNKEQAKIVLEAWKRSIPEELISAFTPLLTALSNWDNEIFSYFDYRAINAYTESVNALIRAVKSVGRGYSFDVIRAKILFSEGIRKQVKVKYDRSLNSFSHSLYDTVAEPTFEYDNLDYGVDISTLLKKLEKGL